MSRPIRVQLPKPAKTAALFVRDLLPERWQVPPSTRRTLRFALESDRWTPEQWRAHQDERIRAVVRHAFEQVPYYRETWRARGVAPGDVDGAASLQALPTIDNRVVRAHFDDLVARDADPARRMLLTTGGTTGVPTRLLLDKDFAAGVERGYVAALWARVGYTLGDRRILLRGALIEGAKTDRPYRYDRSVSGYWFSNFDLTDENLGRLIDLMREFRPRFLHTYPSSATVLANYVRRSGIEPPPLRAVLASSETMYPGQRESIEAALRTRVFSWYGHSERLVLAGECESSTDYHAFPGYGHVELQDESGARVDRPGEEGEIVGTSFYNGVMPLIRYATGDFARHAGDACPACGRSFPMLRDVRGHYWQELIVGDGGRLVSTTAINVHDDTFDRVRQYQFHQRERGALVVRIVKDAGFGPADEARIRERLALRLGALALRFEYVGGIPTTGPGKWKYLVQDLPEGRPGERAPGS
jgi:phenylacetate-CoA ligase